MKPNIGKPLRIFYVAIGVILLIVPLVDRLDLWIRIAAPIVGLSAIFTGASGW